MKNKKIHISFTVTGRCNRGCKYCHFYASHKRDEVERDMEWTIFIGYVEFVSKLLKDGYDITVRFSGGEPLFMPNNMLYKMSDYLYNTIGLSPYVMTNGRLLSEEVIEKAKEHHISSFVLSCENPFKESEGAEHVRDVLEKYIKLKDEQVPIELGLVVIENSEFKNMSKIADFFYDKVGIIPPFSEKNFDTYEKPNDDELFELQNNIEKIVKKYNGVADIHMFPYIVPELYNNSTNEEVTLIEFPLDDIHGYTNMSYESAREKMESIYKINNIHYDCLEKNCELKEYCKVIKWVWFDDRKCDEGDKMKDVERRALA